MLFIFVESWLDFSRVIGGDSGDMRDLWSDFWEFIVNRAVIEVWYR